MRTVFILAAAVVTAMISGCDDSSGPGPGALGVEPRHLGIRVEVPAGNPGPEADTGLPGQGRQAEKRPRGDVRGG